MEEVDWTEILESIDDEVNLPMTQADAKSNLQALVDELRMRIEGLHGEEEETSDD